MCVYVVYVYMRKGAKLMNKYIICSQYWENVLTKLSRTEQNTRDDPSFQE